MRKEYIMKWILTVVFGMLLALPAKAQTTYTYDGNSDISGEFTLFGSPVISTMPIAVDPLTYFFMADGVLFDQANSTAYFEIGTTDSGSIDHWWLDANNGTNSFLTEFTGSQFEATDSVQQNGANISYSQGDAGSWLITPQSKPVSTPEPSEWIMMGEGALWLLWYGKRRWSRK
jgi:hypothetical protein